jgi:hypothetical protein
MGRLEDCVELGPVGHIGLLEDCFGCLGVFVKSVRLRAESKIGYDHVAASFEQAEGKIERDTAATAGNNGSLAVEIVEGHIGVIEWCLLMGIIV